ncbi:caspase family protein [Actinoplanes sp. LDG1-06]|uniref:Caspase family protein n=1 Tax=Paractinoplanes ovalisporus TaxID=2810368 RepID=A0ABS2A4R7_9ACTN|nr:ATP-binding protein [Actinoplanes ovalisporus]MBM2614720.1 caspase family protein [Actinoplanes ovalisporus]
MYRALLVCNSLYEADTTALHELHGPRRDGIALRDALLDPEFGLFEQAEVLPELKLQETAVATNKFFAEAGPEDVLLFYFSGHGLTRNQSFYLCARDTDTSLLLSTALPGRTLAAFVEESLARCCILILDCCHGGAFKSNGATATVIADELAGKGRFVITATTATGLALDAGTTGQTSPFTRALIEGLRWGAVDENDDGFVDLDDLYKNLVVRLPEGGAPQRNFDGSGIVAIARRAASVPAPAPALPSEEPATGLPFLDVPTAATSFSPERITEFRANLRADIARDMPKQLTSAEFLQRAHLLTAGMLTRTGALLFGESPSAVLPTAIVQCARFHGVTKGVALDKEDLKGSVAEQILSAVDFVGSLSRRGEAPTESSPIARPVYRYPMVAVREIIANALVHRDYEHHAVCVHVRVFDDRIEVSSPGGWTNREIPPGERLVLDELGGDSHRRNFRLASTLTWMRLVEGEGSGIPRAILDCQSVGAPKPVVEQRDGVVTVTIYPRTEAPDALALTRMTVDEAAAELDRMVTAEAVERVLAMPPEYAAQRIARMEAPNANTLLTQLDAGAGARLLLTMRSRERDTLLGRLAPAARSAIQEQLQPLVAENGGRILVEIAPDGETPDTYRLSQWYGWNDAGLVRGEDRVVSWDRLQPAVQEVIEATERRYADRDGPITVEFILPSALLNEPVDEWARIGQQYPVVVRSLERMQASQWHRVWRNRWRRLSESPQNAKAYFAGRHDAENPERLEAALRLDPDIVAVVLDEPPSGQENSPTAGVAAALQAGVPVIVWHRDSSAHPEFRDTISKAFSDGEATGLPELVLRWRLNAVASPDDPAQIGRHITLLWDDPSWLPERLEADAPGE